jgi:hypothetical protein
MLRNLFHRISSLAERQGTARAGVLTVQEFPPPVRRWRLASWKGARSAVRSRVPLHEYLTFRFRAYCRRRPQHLHPLPSTVRIDGDAIAVTPNPDADRHPLRRFLEDPAGERAWMDDPREAQLRWIRAQHVAEAQRVARELDDAEQDAARITAGFLEASDALEQHELAREQEIAEGSAAVPATMARSRRQRGWPALPHTGLLLACHALTAVCVAVEAYQLTLPYFDPTGIDSANLAAEWRRNPTGVLAGAGFALMASASIFLLMHWLFETAAALYRGGESAWRTAADAARAAGLGLLLAITASQIGALRHATGDAAGAFIDATNGRAGGAGAGVGVFVLLTFLVPLGAAFVQHKAARARADRRSAREGRRAWEAQQEGLRQVRERRAELIRQAERQRDRLAKQRDAAHERLRALGERAQAAERELRDGIEAERRYSEAFVNSLVAALEQDRFAFIKVARRRGRLELLEPAVQVVAHAPVEPASRALILHPSVAQRPNGANGRTSSWADPEVVP